MSKGKRWTAKEDTVVVSAVKESPTNLSAAFVEASKKIDRTKGACGDRWYTVLSKDKANACFITVSGKHQSLNRKNSKGTPCTISVFSRILKLLGIKK